MSDLFQAPALRQRRPRMAGSMLGPDWLPSNGDREYGRGLGLSEANINDFAEDMRLWAEANANRAIARKANWSAAFKGWMRREAKIRQIGPVPRRNGGFAAIVMAAYSEAETANEHKEFEPDRQDERRALPPGST